MFLFFHFWRSPILILMFLALFANSQTFLFMKNNQLSMSSRLSRSRRGGRKGRPRPKSSIRIIPLGGKHL